MTWRRAPAVGVALATVATVAALAAPPPPAAAAHGARVTIEVSSFAPQRIDVLPGETVTWTNTSPRPHTVTADDGAFDSGSISSDRSYARTFATAGAYPYHCTFHPGMTGEVDVRRLILDPLPPVTLRGRPVTVTGRTADGSSPVAVQQRTAGGFQTVATATPDSDGMWSATIQANTTGDLRAVSGADVSETRRVLVRDRRLHVRVSRRTVVVSVSPPAAGATVVLELYLRERFGWWPVARRRLDRHSRAQFRVPARARARVALVDRDGWTPLMVSDPLRIRPAPAR